MNLAKGLSLGIGALCFVLTVAIGVGWVVTAPTPLAAGSQSAARLAPGPFAVGHDDVRWVDESRPTARNDDYPGSVHRSLPVTLWFPKRSKGAHPLLVFSHGLMSSRHGCTYMAEHLASYGFVVLSADFPLTNAQAPGGPNHLDVVHQPADVSWFVID